MNNTTTTTNSPKQLVSGIIKSLKGLAVADQKSTILGQSFTSRILESAMLGTMAAEDWSEIQTVAELEGYPSGSGVHQQISKGRTICRVSSEKPGEFPKAIALAVKRKAAIAGVADAVLNLNEVYTVALGVKKGDLADRLEKMYSPSESDESEKSEKSDKQAKATPIDAAKLVELFQTLPMPEQRKFVQAALNPALVLMGLLAQSPADQLSILKAVQTAKQATPDVVVPPKKAGKQPAKQAAMQ